MKLKTIVKLGTMTSIVLFVFAVGYFAFMRMDMARHNRDINLFSFVPDDCSGVLDSDNVNAFLGDYPMLNYADELKTFQFSGLFNVILHELNEYMLHRAHGLGGQIDHLLVSFHASSTASDQVVYFKTDIDGERMVTDVLQEYLSDRFLPKEVKYRGKTIYVYPLGDDEFLAVYTGGGFGVMSFQERLIEKVIDAKLDEKSLNDNPGFSEIRNKKKVKNYTTLYSRNSGIPFLEMGDNAWSEYDFHLNSDVLYLTGETYMSEPFPSSVADMNQHATFIKEDSLIVSIVQDSTLVCMNQAFEANECGNRTLFNECVSNLSQEAAFTLVADMQQVIDKPERFQNYLPAFVLDNAHLLRSFVLSVQLIVNEGRPSHIWVFTYKN